MTEPLVSVLIPAYNADQTLAETLDSVLTQTWPRLQVVVVDDGSRDGTLGVARRYESRGVQVVAQGDNRGQTATLNCALEKARGDFVQYLDADDILDPRKIEAQVRRLLAEPPGTLATAPWARFYRDDLATARFVPAADNRDYDEPIEWLLDDWTGHGTMPPGSWLYPRSVIEAVGPWHEGLTLNNDMEYFTRAVLASRKIAFCPEARLYYRSGNPSLSGRRDAAALRSQFEVVRLSTERLLAWEDSTQTRHAAASYWQYFMFMAYPQVPPLVREAEARVASLGGGNRKLEVSRPFRPIARVLGWKPALQLNQLYYRLRYS